jgi:transcriptional regulator
VTREYSKRYRAQIKGAPLHVKGDITTLQREYFALFEKGMSQTEVASKFGVTRQMVNVIYKKWVTG